MVAERDGARTLIGDLPDIGPLDTVLNHFLQNPDEFWWSHGNPLKRVDVVRETDGWSTFVGHDQLAAEIGDWGIDVDRLCQEYLNHKRKKYTIPDRFSDERVVLVTRGELEQFWSDDVYFNREAGCVDRMYMDFWPPVYVDDYCVVRFGFGPTAHGATGTFLLKKTAHSWEIIQKYLAYYV